MKMIEIKRDKEGMRDLIINPAAIEFMKRRKLNREDEGYHQWDISFNSGKTLVLHNRIIKSILKVIEEV